MNEPNEKPKPKTVEQVYELVLKLSAEEREKLNKKLNKMLVQDDEQCTQYEMDPEIERAAIEECKRVDALVREGKMELIDADVVIREARRILDEPGK
jgi:hypothetical protein